EADEIGGDRAEPGSDNDRDDLAPEIRPRRLAVHHQDDRRALRPFVDVRDADAVADLDVMRPPRERGESREALFGRAEDLHPSNETSLIQPYAAHCENHAPIFGSSSAAGTPAAAAIASHAGASASPTARRSRSASASGSTSTYFIASGAR